MFSDLSSALRNIPSVNILHKWRLRVSESEKYFYPEVVSVNKSAGQRQLL